MNLVFHIAASVVFGWLIWKYVQAMRERTILRELLAASRGLGPQRIWIAAPESALARAAAAFGVSYESIGRLAGAPMRIDLGALAGTFVRLDLRLVRCRAGEGGRPEVELHLAAASAEASEVARHLADAFALRVQIVPVG